MPSCETSCLRSLACLRGEKLKGGVRELEETSGAIHSQGTEAHAGAGVLDLKGVSEFFEKKKKPYL